MKKFFFTAFFFVVSLAGKAQCAMCKAVAESGDGGVADGLNEGIVYLMAFPYLLLGAVGYAIYRHKKRTAES